MRNTRMIAVLLGLAGGAAAVGLAPRADHPDLPRALGWAVLAAVAASLAFGRIGRRVLGVMLVVLGVALAWPLPHPGIVAGGVAAITSGALLLTAAGAGERTNRFDRAAPPVPKTDADVWKAMDAGLDPTADEFGDNLAAQARMATPAPDSETPSTSNQEDQ